MNSQIHWHHGYQEACQQRDSADVIYHHYSRRCCRNNGWDKRCCSWKDAFYSHNGIPLNTTPVADNPLHIFPSRQVGVNLAVLIVRTWHDMFYLTVDNYPTKIGTSKSCILKSLLLFTTGLRNKTIRQTLNKNTSPYLHSVSLVIWPLSLMKRTHFSELSISKFSTYIRKAQGWTLHFRTPDPRSEKSQRKMTGRPQIQRRIQAHIL